MKGRGREKEGEGPTVVRGRGQWGCGGRQEVIVCVKDDGGKMIQMILTIEFE
jgi:hypothetical protein